MRRVKKLRFLLLGLAIMSAIAGPSVGQNGAPLPAELVRALTDIQKTRLIEAAKIDQRMIELRKQGKLGEAIQLAKEAAATRREILGEQHSQTGLSLNNLGRLLQANGDYAAAGTTFEVVLKILRKTLGKEHPQIGQALQDLGDVSFAVGDNNAAKAYYTEALGIRKKILGQEHLDTALTHYSLARVLRDQGEYVAARPHYEQALKVLRKVYGEEAPWTATVLNELGVLLHSQGDRPSARIHYEQALTIRKKVLGDEHPDTVISFDNVASVLRAAGDYATARPYYEQVLKIRTKVLGTEHRDTAAALNSLGNLLGELGEYDAARPYCEQALNIRKKVLGEEHRDTAASLASLGVTLHDQGDYGGARSYLELALKIQRKVLGEEHQDTVNSLGYLGDVLRAQGDLAAARVYYEQALKTQIKLSGEEHPTTANHLADLGKLLGDQGEYAVARSYVEKALQIRKKFSGEEHPATAAMLSNLAGLLEDQGDYSGARKNYEQALRIRRKVSGVEHPDTATVLNNIAVLLFYQGDYSVARPYYDQSLAIRRKVLGAKHPSTVVSLNNLGALLRSQGDYNEARPYLVEALEYNRRVLGDLHPTTTRSVINLAVLEAAAEQSGTAGNLFDEARRGVRRHIARVLPSLSEREQELFIRELDQRDFHRALSFGLAHREEPSFTALSAGWLINGKGVAQTALAERTLLMRDQKDPKTADSVRELIEVRRQLASLVMTVPKAEQESVRQLKIDEMTLQEEQLSRQLSVVDGRPAPSDPWVELEEVRKGIPHGSVLIEIALFNVLDFQSRESAKNFQPARYVSWIIPAAGDVLIVDLGPADAIDATVETARRSLAAAATNGATLKTEGESNSERGTRILLQAVADLVWKPLIDKVGDCRQLFLSPDAALWLLPWGALPTENDRYLVEDYSLTYLISGRDLVSRAASTVSGTQPIVIANPDFDLTADKVRAAIKAALPNVTFPEDIEANLLSVRNALPKVLRLPGTAAEAELIRPNVEKYAGSSPVVYTDDGALETVFKTAQHPTLAVLSTHGFFLADQEVRNDGPLNSGNTRAAALKVDGKPIENPLLRCGLLLAGCNQPQSSGGDDGVLTGMEIVGIDLRGTELVVLSACETGVGQVRNAEGVAGLRQAFQLAGARSVVATLWQVPDRDSTILMNDFFANLASGQSKSEALRNAQLKRISARRDRYGGSHPYFWAAWTLTGQ